MPPVRLRLGGVLLGALLFASGAIMSALVLRRMHWTCGEQGRAASDNDDAAADLVPTLFLVTPTHNRPAQKADLTRLCQVWWLEHETLIFGRH